ncbi:hypothetical protein SELMODRAFT_131123 [Selaginella moellendorffii]|uniref:Alginate lyase 2 domain-containing protein n=2 Tax=Selaginella moellendorffii TaxID=88036 RepID=D8T3N7_SELML|nr:hypothetical protein SELMODRAFT_131123 [Selaginella moellendorffii]
MFVLANVLLSLLCCEFAFGVDPTVGFEKQQVSWKIQKPYDLQVSDRYNFSDGVHKLWVYTSDKPQNPHSPTKPRTELRFRQPQYSQGIWQFEGDFYVPSGTTGVCIMQIHGGRNSATALQIRVDGPGDLIRTGADLEHATFATHIYDKWIHLNVIHDVDHEMLSIYLDGELKHWEVNETYEEHYFKCGVYTQNNASEYMESRWKNINIWKL